MCSKYEVVKVAIWQHFLIRHFFNICVLSFSNKILHCNRAGQEFFCKHLVDVTLIFFAEKKTPLDYCHRIFGFGLEYLAVIATGHLFHYFSDLLRHPNQV